MAKQTPMFQWSKLLRERIANLMVRVDVRELELLGDGAVFAQRLEGNVDMLYLVVLAGVLDLLDARCVVLEDDDGAHVIISSGVKFCIEPEQPMRFAGGFIERTQLGV